MRDGMEKSDSAIARALDTAVCTKGTQGAY